MDVTEKMSFLDDRVVSEKFKYLENGTIFFQTVCVEIHQTFARITYTKTIQIRDQLPMNP